MKCLPFKNELMRYLFNDFFEEKDIRNEKFFLKKIEMRLIINRCSMGRIICPVNEKRCSTTVKLLQLVEPNQIFGQFYDTLLRRSSTCLVYTNSIHLYDGRMDIQMAMRRCNVSQIRCQ